MAVTWTVWLEVWSWTQLVKGSTCQFWNHIHENSILHSAARGIFLKSKTDHVISLLYNLWRPPFARGYSWRPHPGLQVPDLLISPTFPGSPHQPPPHRQASVTAGFLSCSPFITALQLPPSLTWVDPKSRTLPRRLLSFLSYSRVSSSSWNVSLSTVIFLYLLVYFLSPFQRKIWPREN